MKIRYFLVGGALLAAAYKVGRQGGAVPPAIPPVVPKGERPIQLRWRVQAAVVAVSVTAIIGFAVIRFVDPPMPCHAQFPEVTKILVDAIVVWYLGIGGVFIFLSALVSLIARDTRLELASQCLNVSGTLIAGYGAALAVDPVRAWLVGA